MGRPHRVIRGTILIGRAPGDFTSKARPYVVMQSEVASEIVRTLTVCPITTSLIGVGRVRVPIAPTEANGLDHASEIEVDRITTIRLERFDPPIGAAGREVMNLVDASLRRWLDL